MRHEIAASRRRVASSLPLLMMMRSLIPTGSGRSVPAFVTEPEVGVIGGLVLPLELDTEPQLWFEEFYGGFSQSFQAETLSIEAQKGKDPMFSYASTIRRNSAPPSSSCTSSVP